MWVEELIYITSKELNTSVHESLLQKDQNSFGRDYLGARQSNNLASRSPSRLMRHASRRRNWHGRRTRVVAELQVAHPVDRGLNERNMQSRMGVPIY
eukprot:SAG31_NODE_10572_length_1123_cov_0.875000_2_plen_96_part_01